MRIEKVFCEDCGVTHYVQIMQRDRQGLVIKTKCLGKDFLPIQSNPLVNQEPSYIKHRLRGYDIIKKAPNQPKNKLVTTFKRERLIPQPVVPVNRACIAELSLTVHGKFVTIKVFDNATPDKFYEFFYEVGEKPTMIKPRNLGRDKPVHISDIPNIYKIQGKVNLVFHNRAAYEKLLIHNPELVTNILEKNVLVAQGVNNSTK